MRLLLRRSRGLLLLFVIVAVTGSLYSANAATQQDGSSSSKASPLEEVSLLRTIEGRVVLEGVTDDGWLARTKVVVDGGRYYGFLRSNGQFEIPRVPPGSFLVEVVSPNHVFEPVRVEISSKSGKIRAKKVNLLKPSSVSSASYPLKFKADRRATFFEKREKWSIFDTLKNPMVRLIVVLQSAVILT